jgi:hypothetical protein
VTGDSDNIDCEPCESAKHAAHYVSKYIGKPADLALTGNTKRATEYYRSLKKTRLLIPFGDTRLHRPPSRPPPPASRQIGRFAHILRAATAGDLPARYLVAAVIAQTVPGTVLDLESVMYKQSLLFERGPP